MGGVQIGSIIGDDGKIDLNNAKCCAMGKIDNSSDFVLESSVATCTPIIEDIIDDTLCCAGNMKDGGAPVQLCESTGEALCTGFEETVDDNVIHTKLPPPKRNQVPGYEINWDPLYAEYVPPQRIAPAGPKGVDHNAIDATVDACRMLEKLEPPPREAPAARDSSSFGNLNDTIKSDIDTSIARRGWRVAPPPPQAAPCPWDNAAPDESERHGKSRSRGLPTRVAPANAAAVSRTAQPPGVFVLHMKVGYNRTLRMGFLGNENLDSVIGDFLRHNDLPLGLHSTILRRAKSLVVLGEPEDFVDISEDALAGLTARPSPFD